MRPAARALGAGLALGLTAAHGALVLGGCEQILGLPERTEIPNIACEEGVCACVADFGDCDATLDPNGCERHLPDDELHCGACGHDCESAPETLGPNGSDEVGLGACIDAACDFRLLAPATEIAGPAVFAGRIFYLERATGRLMASPAHGEPQFTPFLELPVDEYFANFFTAPDALYMVHARFGGSVHIVRIDASDTVTEPFGVLPWGMNSDIELAVTSDAVFYVEGVEITRVDRATLQRTVVSDFAETGPRARGDDFYFAEDDKLFVVHPGGATELVVDEESGSRICKVYPLEVGFGVARCPSQELELRDEQWNLLTTTTAEVLDAVVHEGKLYFLDDARNEVRRLDATGVTIVAVSQPFGYGLFRVAADGGALYWGGKNGIVRRVL